MILDPPNQLDVFRPMRQRDIVDALNQNHEIVPSGAGAQVISTGRGRGIHLRDAPQVNALAKVRVTTNCTDGGVYNAKIAVFASELPLPTGNTGSSLSTAALATYPEDDDAIYCNTNEIGQDTHALTVETNITEFWGRYLGINEDGRHVVEGSGFQTRLCPVTS